MIRNRRILGVNLKEISELYNVSVTPIRRICNDIIIEKSINFSKEQINDIIQMRKQGNSYNKILKNYNVSCSTIRRICIENI